MKKAAKRYRYSSKDHKKHTRWKDLPADGIDRPTKEQARRLGEGYGVEIVRASESKR